MTGPYCRRALIAAEVVRVAQPDSQQAFNTAVFDSYVALGNNIEDAAVLAECVEDVGINPSAFTDETPAAVVGLRSRAFFLALGDTLTSRHHTTDQASAERPGR